MRLTLRSEKDADQAKAVYEWMRLQPLESVDLPHAARKFPIQSLERTDDKGTAFTFTVTNWTALKEPLGWMPVSSPSKIQSGTSAP